MQVLCNQIQVEHAACPPLQGATVHLSQTLKITKLLKTTGRNVSCENIAMLSKVKLWDGTHKLPCSKRAIFRETIYFTAWNKTTGWNVLILL